MKKGSNVIIIYYCQEKFDATYGVIRNRQSQKDRKNNGRKRTKEQTLIYKTLHSKLKNKTNPLSTWGELKCSGRVSSSFATNSNSININNANNHLSPQFTEHNCKKTTTYGVGNPDPGWEQEHEYLGIKGIISLSLSIICNCSGTVIFSVHFVT